MASSLAFSPDGALFVGDWDGMWEPNEKGAIWRLDDPREASSPSRAEVRHLLAEGLSSQSIAALATLLGHADQRIRQRAQQELVRREADEVLLRIARSQDAQRLARVHALWGIGQRHRPVSAESLPFTDPDPEIRAQAAKVAGDLKLPVTVMLMER